MYEHKILNRESGVSMNGWLSGEHRGEMEKEREGKWKAREGLRKARKGSRGGESHYLLHGRKCLIHLLHKTFDYNSCFWGDCLRNSVEMFSIVLSLVLMSC